MSPTAVSDTGLRPHLLPEQLAQNVIAVEAEMFGGIGNNAGKRPVAEGVVIGNREVMLAVSLSGQPHMAAALTHDFIAEDPQCGCKFPPAYIAG